MLPGPQFLLGLWWPVAQSVDSGCPTLCRALSRMEIKSQSLCPYGQLQRAGGETSQGLPCGPLGGAEALPSRLPSLLLAPGPRSVHGTDGEALGPGGSGWGAQPCSASRQRTGMGWQFSSCLCPFWSLYLHPTLLLLFSLLFRPNPDQPGGESPQPAPHHHRP